MTCVSIKEVSKSYQKQKVLDKISLSLKKGELATLLGQSGCGKSTLLRSVAGLTEIDEGSIYLEEKEITSLPPREREVGMVFQSYALFPNMNVFENVAFGLKMRKMDRVKERVSDMLELVGLTGKENAYPHELSGGQQQRVALARSLVMQPRVLLLDEPLSALDAKIRKNLQNEIKRIQKELNITAIFVTHDQEEAMTISDTIHIMQEGKIVQSGTPAEIYTTPQNPFVARFIGNYNVISMQDFYQLVGNHSLRGNEMAIRPEMIQICDGSDCDGEEVDEWIAGGTIAQVFMTGNVLRYEIDTSVAVIRVDELHAGNRVRIPGEEVRLRFPRSACLVY